MAASSTSTVDDFYTRALSALAQQQLTLANDNDDGGEKVLESYIASLVEDDNPKIERAVKSFLALIAARASVASDVDVISTSSSHPQSMTQLLAAGNRCLLLCARALLSAIDSTIIPPLDVMNDVSDNENTMDETMVTKTKLSSQKNAATRLVWNKLAVRFDEMTKRTNKPSKILGRRSLLVAYPYIHERLRRGRYHNIGQLPDVDDDSQLEQRAIRLMSDEVLPPVIPPKGIDLDQWESFYLEFERLLPHGGDDDDDCNDGERGSSKSLERKNDDSALLWSKDGGLAELKARREDRARRAMSGSSKSVEDTIR
jgi:hypothetical protein